MLLFKKFWKGRSTAAELTLKGLWGVYGVEKDEVGRTITCNDAFYLRVMIQQREKWIWEEQMGEKKWER
jgi:hypothetical protein